MEEDCDLCAWAEAEAKRTALVTVDAKGGLVLPGKVRRGLGVLRGGILHFRLTTEGCCEVVTLSPKRRRARTARRAARTSSRMAPARVIPMTPPRDPRDPSLRSG